MLKNHSDKLSRHMIAMLVAFDVNFPVQFYHVTGMCYVSSCLTLILTKLFHAYHHSFLIIRIKSFKNIYDPKL